MFLSIIVHSQNHPSKILKTIVSIRKQTLRDYEVIFINDTGYTPKHPIMDLFDSVFHEHEKENVKIISFSRSQGFSYAINEGIHAAEGKYCMILEEGELLEPTAIEVLKKSVGKKDVDILEFGYENNSNVSHNVFINENLKTKNPQVNKEVVAFANSSIGNKMYSVEFLNKNKLFFKRYKRFDSLFFYKAIAKANSYLTIHDKIAIFDSAIISYSVFDLLKQWSHIFNYYRDRNIYNNFRNEIEYAYVRFCLVTFLDIITNQNNNNLSHKAYSTVFNKYKKRFRNYRQNKYAKNIVGDKYFATVANDISKYLKIWKENNCK